MHRCRSRRIKFATERWVELQHPLRTNGTVGVVDDLDEVVDASSMSDLKCRGHPSFLLNVPRGERCYLSELENRPQGLIYLDYDPIQESYP